MNVKQLTAILQDLDLAGDGNTVVDVVTATGTVKRIVKVQFSPITGSITIVTGTGRSL